MAALSLGLKLVVGDGGDIVCRTTPGLRVVVVAVVNAWAGIEIMHDGEVKCAVTLSESGTHQRRVGNSGEMKCTAQEDTIPYQHKSQ